jgi:DNA invertase Pin-like site-specific DNA recombinase
MTTSPTPEPSRPSRIGYARVSTGDQNLDQQIHRLTEGGGQCDTVFADKGVSGTQARRPNWDKALENLQPGDTLVTVKLDRIARSVPNLYDVVRDLTGREVALEILDQPEVSMTTRTGKLMLAILGAIAEFERDLIVDRTKDGQAAVRRAGNLRRTLGGTPVLGFREDPEGDDWQIDPAAAEWLAEAAERVLGGEPVEAVAAILPELHDAAGRVVNAKMLRAALTRPASAGLIADPDGEIEAAIGGPLSVATFRRLEVLFGARRRGRPATAGRYPFGPVLRCAVCGNQLTGQPGWKGRGYYACRNPHKALGVTRPCRGVSVPAEDVHDLIRDAVMAWAETPAAKLAAARTPETASRKAELDARIAEAQGWLADLEAKRVRRYITPAKYAELVAEITVQIDASVAELDELAKVDAEGGLPVVIEWDALTDAEKLRTLAEAVQTPIAVQPGNGGGAALSAADRIDMIPAGVAA